MRVRYADRVARRHAPTMWSLAAAITLTCALANERRLRRVNAQLLDEGLLSAARRQAEELERAALHDPLTGLPNRTLLALHLADAVRRSREGHAVMAVLVVDLNGFKAVNDRLGQASGDLLLTAFGERLHGCLRAGALAARMGGDEFAVVVEDLLTATEATAVAQRILDGATRPFAIAGHEVRVGASIGVAVLDPSHAQTTVDDLLHRADMAMYDAKRAGGAGGAYRCFDAGLHAAALLHHELELQLTDALDNGEIRAVYQPIVDISSREMLGVEALMRWHHPGHGVLTPDAFILQAVENGLMSRIGAVMLRTACAQIRAWDASLGGAAPSYVAVNISAQHVDSGMLVRDVCEALSAAQLTPERLMIELTEESAVDQQTHGVGTLSELRRLGVRVAIDDFGSRYSSLNYLLGLPVDVLKLDRTFVQPLTASPRSASVVRALSALSKDLGLALVAEGVETEEQAALLRSLGVSRAQGYLYSRPLPPEVLAAQVGGHRPDHDVPEPRSGAVDVPAQQHAE